MSAPRLFALMAYDPATGWASAPVAVAGVAAGDAGWVSWVPYHDLAEGWRARVAAATVPLAEALGRWAELADGVASDVIELEAPASADLRGAVEAALDDVLALGGR